MAGVYIQAFPGMGKSTIAVKYEQVVDADFGIWRKNKTGGKHFWELTEAETKALHLEFIETVVTPALEAGKIVLTNEPGLAAYVPKGFKIFTVIPHSNFYATHLYGILSRTYDASGDKEFTDPNSFIVKLCINYKEWVNNWHGGTLKKFTSYDDWEILIKPYL